MSRNPNKRRGEEDEDIIIDQDKHLGYFTRYKQSVCITVPIDESFREAKYYRSVVKAIADTDENDQVEFEIASPGGLLNGLLALLTALEKTEATTVAHLNGECHSAASMLALSCDVIYVSPYASMLVHFIQYGASGKATDVRSQVEHTHQTSEKLFKDVYKYFLTDDEMQKCIAGLELWLDSDEITARLQRKFEILNKQQDEAKPKKTRSKTKEVIVKES